MVRTATILGMAGDEAVDKLERIGDESYEGVEVGVQNAGSKSFVEALDETELDVTSIMTGLGHVEEPSDELVSACHTFDVDRVVLGWLDESYFESPAATEETARLLSECADGLVEHDLTLCYHNHDHEFASFGDRTAFEVLVEHLDDRVEFEVDVGWVGVGGEDPVEFLETYGDRVPLVHFKDMHFETGNPVALGGGDLDAERVAETAAEQGVEWLIYEDEGDSTTAEKVRHGSRELTTLTGRGGAI